MGDGVLLRRVSPFGHRRIIASVQLPDAFRRLRVLLRQLVPRHSSRTLKSFTRLCEAKISRVLDAYASFGNIAIQLSKSSFAGHFVFSQRRGGMIPGTFLKSKAPSQFL